MEKKKNKIVLLLLKGLVSIFILGLIINKIGFENITNAFKTLNPYNFIVASLLYIFSIYVSSIRWRILLQVEGTYPIGVKRLFSIYMIGSFFNNLLPGIIGGDTMRIYYLYKETGSGVSSTGSVLADRYMGFISLLLLGLLALTVSFNKIKGTGVEYALPLITTAFGVGSIVFFRLQIGNRYSGLKDFYIYFHSLFKSLRILFNALFYSLLVQVLIVLSVFSISEGMNLGVTLVDIFLLMPIVVTITAIPVSFSGIGLREGIFIILFGKVGLSPELSTALSFIWFLSYSAGSLLGLIFYLRWRPKDGQ